MSISPFFRHLRSAYQSEMEDLTFDSDGRDVLRQRLADKRKEISFLLQMMELCPEMVAVIFHQGFRFQQPAQMDQLLGLEADELPDWGGLAEGIEMTPWASELAQAVLKAPGGEWFLTVAAALEYMAGKPAAAPAMQDDSEESDDAGANEDADHQEDFDADEDGDERASKEAGADWLVEQGFDRKD
ncbi:hypothetical protein [Polaromonas jejuensis]|uniref:Uncharacterized protein n=1 Tax=Polaromonas jejuensis TaxID=457502 RepID=A0ABW0QFC1_9BURK|nr:hypothetical protein [Polaromonas jejuensis]